MKHIATIVGSALLTLSPIFSFCAFAIYRGKSEVFDAICFFVFGATCYALAHIQNYIKNN